MRSLLIGLALLSAFVAAGGAAWLGLRNQGAEDSSYRTAKVERGAVAVTVGATGTLEPEELINVGAQVVGRIQEFGLDPRAESDPKFKDKRIDYGSPVNEGTVLARIDPLIYQAQYDQAQAALDRAVADLSQLQARLIQAKAEWDRAEKLNAATVNDRRQLTAASTRAAAIPIQAISNSDYILAKANYATANASVEIGKAAIKQQQAILALARTNLDYTVISSPVQGTIIDRRVNIGQTVVASLNAPSLFLLAKDLRRMQVWASVNEADIGQLKAGIPVRFTVDAFPEQEFTGTVEQIRYNASMTQNVVTYTVVVSVDNSDLKLLPYLTADVKFEVQRREAVLRVPNNALRFQPKPERIALVSQADAVDDRGQQANLWIESDGLLKAIPVEAGLSDGAFTEVSGAGLSEGMEVIVGEGPSAVAEQVNNPFAPRFPGRPR